MYCMSGLPVPANGGVQARESQHRQPTDEKHDNEREDEQEFHRRLSRLTTEKAAQHNLVLVSFQQGSLQHAHERPFTSDRPCTQITKHY